MHTALVSNPTLHPILHSPSDHLSYLACIDDSTPIRSGFHKMPAYDSMRCMVCTLGQKYKSRDGKEEFAGNHLIDTLECSYYAFSGIEVLEVTSLVNLY